MINSDKYDHIDHKNDSIGYLMVKTTLDTCQAQTALKLTNIPNYSCI